MTDWRAVFIGFLVGIVLSVFAFAIPVVGHLGAGLIAGFVAGFVAGGGLLRGAWHGLLAGALGGLVVAIGIGLFALLVGTLALGPPGFLGGVGAFAIAAIIAFVLALDSAIGGALGGLLG